MPVELDWARGDNFLQPVASQGRSFTVKRTELVDRSERLTKAASARVMACDRQQWLMPLMSRTREAFDAYVKRLKDATNRQGNAMPFGERTTITVIDRQPLPPIAARAAKQLALKVAESEPLKLVHAADFDVGGGVQRLRVLRALTVPDADCARVEFKYGNQLGIVFFFFRFDGELTATDAARIADKVKNSVDKYVGRAQRAVYMRMLKAAAAVDGRYRASALQDALAFITDDASSAATRAVDGELAEMLAAASCEEDLRVVVAARIAGRREAPRSETFEDFYECVQRRLQSMNPAAKRRVLMVFGPINALHSLRP
jgi:hypothetical protein